MKRFQDPGRALRRLEWIEAIIMGYDPGAAKVHLAVRPNVLVRANNWNSIRQVFKEAYPIIKESQGTRHIAKL